MSKNTYFITGISTEVGKTVASAIVTEALEADYWKPIQAGDLGHSDTHKVRSLVSNTRTQFHPNAFSLNTPMSPHAAADIDGVTIKASEIKRPKTKNNLVIEGAGGLLVPINDAETILDLIAPEDRVIIVSRHYLGSINHTLLTVDKLKQAGKTIFGILFSGDEHPTTEAVIEKMSGVPVLGRIDEEPYFDKMVVKEYAELLKEILSKQ
ncbi:MULTISPECIES: dethiobiotin synthase [unclassified Leeuwenhoekiella]|uniref:dethiobiotin synthase n=1 Tax=unclassified Leeuwenhoekiella TaxID=2615029 RepID=UPI000C3A24EB|nr:MULTISPECIES: dethiobiotin synthase [unclassified Leeuwenhoekiella]MAW95778.1 dethiobiotin synthase [Leeuwenhoekiella sp.]MBA82951.1 dethiobiotin synthase [Leeuwenhoekiella sp.]|tara:strand:+ start:6509 stop:7135 length:627 start_codon:yes stop_codon:yes gene_type:complete